MSPLSLSAPSTQPSPSQTSRKGVRFGQGAEKTPEKAKAAQEASETAPVESVKDSVEIGKEPAPEKPDSKPAPESLSIFDRIGKFFEYLKKAFNVLFGGKNQAPGDAAKSESELQWKGLKPFLKPVFYEDGFSELPEAKAELQEQLLTVGEKAQKDLKTNALLKHLRNTYETLSASNDKDTYKGFLKDTATKEGRLQFINDYLDVPPSKVLEEVNKTEQKGGNPSLTAEELQALLCLKPEAAPDLYQAALVLPESKVKTKSELAKRMITPSAYMKAFSPSAIKRALASSSEQSEESPEA